MTLPDERTRAVLNARDFLLKLMHPRLSPKIPKAIRQEARSILKHYPWPMNLKGEEFDRAVIDEYYEGIKK